MRIDLPVPFISKTSRLSDPIVTAGDRLYAIGSQNGLFPDSWGGHVPNEMWGIWAHPIKLLDGFWLGLAHPTFGSVRWLCEADACRASPGFTEFDYRFPGLTITRRDFAPDGLPALVVSLRVTASGEWPADMRLRACFASDLRPAWLGEQVGWRDAPDEAVFDATRGVVLFRDRDNPWFAVVGAINTPAHKDAVRVTIGKREMALQQTAGQGAVASLTWTLEQKGGNTAELTLLIAGSAHSAEDALATLDRLRAEHAALFETKQRRYQAILDTCALVTPDETLNEAFAWSKLNCQMLARDVPGQGGADAMRGAGAGLPVYPWWFGIDIAYAALPMLQAGLFGLTQDSLRLLQRASAKANPDEPGRVIHELTTTGVVFNPGNLVESPAFVRAVHHCWLWTGDDAFLRALYPFCKQALLDYTLGACDLDGDLCGSGRSIIETPEMHAGLECIDVAVYTWQALLALADLAQTVGDLDALPDLRRKADELAGRIRREWWLEDEGLFADVRATRREVNALLADLDKVVREQNWLAGSTQQAEAGARQFAPWLARYAGAPDDVDLPWLLRHWIVLCPLEAGLATDEQAARAFARLESPEFSDEWGMVLHPDRRDVMSINTGLLALAEARYGRLEQALRYVRKLAGALAVRTPGAISEALPDQWCFLQLWSALGVISPIVEGVFGVEPRAAERRLRVTANLPAGWPQAELRRVRIGDAFVDLRAEQDGPADAICERRLCVACTDPDYALEIGCAVPNEAGVAGVWLNGRRASASAQPAEWRLEQTRAGQRVVCRAHGSAEMVVRFVAATSPG